MVVARPLVVGKPVTTRSKRKPSGASQLKKKGVEEPFLKYQTYSFAPAAEGQFNTEKKMLDIYGKLKEMAKIETQRQSEELRKFSSSKVSLTTARNLTTSSLNLAIANEEGVSELEFKMDNFSILDKIVFRKGVSDIIYVSMTNQALDHFKSQ